MEDEGLVGCSVFVELGSGGFDVYVVNEVESNIFDVVEIIIVISKSLEVFFAAVEAVRYQLANRTVPHPRGLEAERTNTCATSLLMSISRSSCRSSNVGSLN